MTHLFERFQPMIMKLYKTGGTLMKTFVSICLELQFLRRELIISYPFQVICQLEGGTQILYINSCGTQELKSVHLIPEYQNQHNYLQSGTITMKIISRLSDCIS